MSFETIGLSATLLRAINEKGYKVPTPVQEQAIPPILKGHDALVSAQTGTGKTAAFTLPILQLLSKLPIKNNIYKRPVHALVLTPTRELAAQVFENVQMYGKYLPFKSDKVFGGVNINPQIKELRSGVDILIATPGRLLDLIGQGVVDLSRIKMFVLDEADRLLDLGFQDEVQELIKSCPIERQTLLFSATMNTKVDDLIKLSMKRPVRIKISNKDAKSNKDLEVAPRLEQEFVRVRSGNEGINREGMLLALLTRTFSTQTIVFFDTKAKAHRMMILCGLCGIKCAELHGNLSQAQRLEALEQFRKGEVDILLATDLAARGLDISRVETVVNFEMPNQVETYIHRIGRTARGLATTGHALVFFESAGLSVLYNVLLVPAWAGLPHTRVGWHSTNS